MCAAPLSFVGVLRGRGDRLRPPAAVVLGAVLLLGVRVLEELVLQLHAPQDLVLLPQLLESLHLVDLGLLERLVGHAHLADLTDVPLLGFHRPAPAILDILPAVLIGSSIPVEEVASSVVLGATGPSGVAALVVVHVRVGGHRYGTQILNNKQPFYLCK